MDPRIIARAARVGNVIETVLAKLRPGRDGPTGKTLRVITYRSLGDTETLTVSGRVVRMAPTRLRKVDQLGAIPAREHLAAVYRAFDVLEIPNAALAVSCRGVENSGTSDDGGYFSIALRAPAGQSWPEGWHDCDVRVLGAPAHATRSDGSGHRHEVTTASVFVPSTKATLAIVSDLDDTAMDTHTTRTLRMLRTVLLQSALRRQAVPGIPALYRALQAGIDRRAGNPVCYISSSAWNLYDVIVDYLDAHALPRGPVILHDWGSRQRSFHTVAFEHKGAHVGAMLDRYRSLPFLLIGDDVNEDPELYTTLALARPGRVAAIWIRALRGGDRRRSEIERLRHSLRESGTELVLASDTAGFATAAGQRGWILPEEFG